MIKEIFLKDYSLNSPNLLLIILFLKLFFIKNFKIFYSFFFQFSNSFYFNNMNKNKILQKKRIFPFKIANNKNCQPRKNRNYILYSQIISLRFISFGYFSENLQLCLIFLTGGAPDIVRTTGGRYAKGIVGCISDLVLDSDFSVALSSPGQATNTHSCIPWKTSVPSDVRWSGPRGPALRIWKCITVNKSWPSQRKGGRRCPAFKAERTLLPCDTPWTLITSI